VLATRPNACQSDENLSDGYNYSEFGVVKYYYINWSIAEKYALRVQIRLPQFFIITLGPTASMRRSKVRGLLVAWMPICEAVLHGHGFVCHKAICNLRGAACVSKCAHCLCFQATAYAWEQGDPSCARTCTHNPKARARTHTHTVTIYALLCLIIYAII